MKTYAQRLAVELDREGVSDADAERALDAVREWEKSGKDPAESLGEPEDYAKTFPKSVKEKRRYQRPVNIGGVLALIWFVGWVVYMKKNDDHPPVDLVLFVGPLCLILASIGVTEWESRRRARRRFR